MHWIYLSPHFDDVVLSCGGLVWEQVRAGQPVAVWTVCAGGPRPEDALSDFARSLHERWGTGPEAVTVRRVEDEQALCMLGAEMRYWDLPDCIYRRLPDGSWLINNNDELWQPLHPAEQGVVDRLADWIARGLEQVSDPADIRLVSPITLGNHVDHAVVRAAVEQAAHQTRSLKPVSLWYYADYPYAANAETGWAGKLVEGWQRVCEPVSPQALAVWQESVARYESQLSTFWSTRAELNASLEAYWRSGGGTCLWRAADI